MVLLYICISMLIVNAHAPLNPSNVLEMCSVRGRLLCCWLVGCWLEYLFAKARVKPVKSLRIRAHLQAQAQHISSERARGARAACSRAIFSHSADSANAGRRAVLRCVQNRCTGAATQASEQTILYKIYTEYGLYIHGHAQFVCGDVRQ